MGNGSDISLTCRQCGKQFIFSESEQQFYQQKGFAMPNHCQECRAIRRAQNTPLCSKCGKTLGNTADICCIECLEIARLEIVLEARSLKEELAEAGHKLNAGESEKARLIDTLNTKLAAIESEKTHLASEFSTKLNNLESEKTNLAAQFEQQKQATIELQEKLSNIQLELEKALKYRATLEYLEPTLGSIMTALQNLKDRQEDIKKTMIQWANRADEKSQNTGIIEIVKRIFRIGRKSASTVN